MWYVVDILFAKSSDFDSDTVQCESCNVLFEAPSALAAYEKAENWGREYEKFNNFQYVGIHNLWSLDCDTPEEGTEVGGAFFEEQYFWQRIDTFIPDKNEIPTIKGEANRNIPIGELMSDEQKEQMRKIFDEE